MKDFIYSISRNFDYLMIYCLWKNNERSLYGDYSNLRIEPEFVNNPMSISFKGYKLVFRGRNVGATLRLNRMFLSDTELKDIEKYYSELFDIQDKYEMQDVI